jgi:uncharacterized protein (DUF58 family)
MPPAETANANYLDPASLDKIKRLDVRARVVVEGFITGQHRSPYNGFAIEFAAHREYAPGDDLRHIDWKVWSKTDRLYIKEYEEETNLSCHLLIDCSKSMRYGEATGWSKFDYACTAAASLGYLLQQQQDAVGLVLFSNKIDQRLKASSHPSHLKLMLHELENAQPANETDIAEPFLSLGGALRKRGMIALFSDLFLDPETLAKSIKQLRMRQHEVIVFQVMHQDELEFPFQDNTLFKGMETEASLHTEPRALRATYLEAVERHQTAVKKICASAGVDHVLLDTSKPLGEVLSSYLLFRARSRKKKR